MTVFFFEMSRFQISPSLSSEISKRQAFVLLKFRNFVSPQAVLVTGSPRKAMPQPFENKQTCTYVRTYVLYGVLSNHYRRAYRPDFLGFPFFPDFIGVVFFFNPWFSCSFGRRPVEKQKDKKNSITQGFINHFLRLGARMHLFCVRRKNLHQFVIVF